MLKLKKIKIFIFLFACSLILSSCASKTTKQAPDFKPPIENGKLQLIFIKNGTFFAKTENGKPFKLSLNIFKDSSTINDIIKSDPYNAWQNLFYKVSKDRDSVLYVQDFTEGTLKGSLQSYKVGAKSEKLADNVSLPFLTSTDGKRILYVSSDNSGKENNLYLNTSGSIEKIDSGYISPLFLDGDFLMYLKYTGDIKNEIYDIYIRNGSNLFCAAKNVKGYIYSKGSKGIYYTDSQSTLSFVGIDGASMLMDKNVSKMISINNYFTTDSDGVFYTKNIDDDTNKEELYHTNKKKEIKLITSGVDSQFQLSKDGSTLLFLKGNDKNNMSLFCVRGDNQGRLENAKMLDANINVDSLNPGISCLSSDGRKAVYIKNNKENASQDIYMYDFEKGNFKFIDSAPKINEVLVSEVSGKVYYINSKSNELTSYDDTDGIEKLVSNVNSFSEGENGDLFFLCSMDSNTLKGDLYFRHNGKNEKLTEDVDMIMFPSLYER